MAPTTYSRLVSGYRRGPITLLHSYSLFSTYFSSSCALIIIKTDCLFHHIRELGPVDIPSLNYLYSECRQQTNLFLFPLHQLTENRSIQKQKSHHPINANDSNPFWQQTLINANWLNSKELPTANQDKETTKELRTKFLISLIWNLTV